MEVDDFLSNPTKITNALRAVHGHLQTDGIYSCGDWNALPKALGISPDATADLSEEALHFMADEISSLMDKPDTTNATEVTKRLKILLPEEALKAVVMGPWTLARWWTKLSNEELLDHPQVMNLASRAVLNFVKELGISGVDIIMIKEEKIPALNEQTKAVIKKSFSPFLNTAKFHNITTYTMIDELELSEAKGINRLLGGLIIDAENAGDLIGSLRKVSVTIPVDLLEREPDEIELYLNETGIKQAVEDSRLQLLTTTTEVPGEINNEFMIRGIQRIQQVLGN